MATEKELKDRLAKEKAKVNDEKKSDTIRNKAKKKIAEIENDLAKLGGDVVKGAKEVVTKGKDLAKMTDKEFEEAKKDLADKLGNTEEECENIIKEFKEQRAKAKRSKAKRTKKLQTSGQTTTPKSSEINAKKVLSNASNTIGDKLQSQVDGLESEAKRDAKDKVKDQNLTTAQKNKKVEELVKNEVRKKSKFIADSVAIETKGILSEISKKLGDIDKQLRLTYLRKVKAEVEALISKMMFGGLTDGAVANMNVTQSQMSAESVNPQMYAEGGGVNVRDIDYKVGSYGKETFGGVTYFPTSIMTKDDFFDSNILDYDDVEVMYQGKRSLTLREIRERLQELRGKEDGDDTFKEVIYEVETREGNFAKGGKTWIDSGKQNVQTRGSKGTFRAKADKQGISSGQLADKILANPSKYSKGERKSAQFVENIGVKEEGGEIMTADTQFEYAKGGYVRVPNDTIYKDVIDVKQNGDFYIVKNYVPYDYDSSTIVYFVSDIKGNEYGQYPTLEQAEKQFEKAIRGQAKDYAKGGRMEQGYNDRMDESLGMRHRGRHSQGHKDRRDEAKGMNKATGNRAYQSVGTMDRNNDPNDFYGAFEEGGQLFDDLKIKKGAFTKKAKQRGLSTEAFMRKVLANPSRYDERTRKQAQLMKNMM